MRSVWALCMVLLVTGCGTTATGPQLPPLEAVEASVGTANYTGSPPFGTFFFFIFRLRNRAPADGLTVTVRGPEGWNNNLPLQLRFSWLANKVGGWWAWYAYRGINARSGNYVLETTIDGTAYRLTRSVDASAFLPRTSQINVNGTRGQVNISWAAVPGAGSYQVGIYRVDTGSEIVSWYGTGTQVVLDVEPPLDPAGSYVAFVRAFSLDLGNDLLPQLGRQANYSQVDSGRLNPAAAGSVEEATGERPAGHGESGNGMMRR